MEPPSRDAFVGRLRGLDREALTAFVADLHATRGDAVDRWADDGRAAEAATALAAANPTTLRWGRYTLRAAVYPRSSADDSSTQPPTTTPEGADTRTPRRAGLTLLSHATAPSGRRFGRDCVSRLLVEPNATGR